jgi:hypothetical protein
MCTLLGGGLAMDFLGGSGAWVKTGSAALMKLGKFNPTQLFLHPMLNVGKEPTRKPHVKQAMRCLCCRLQVLGPL